MNAYTTQSRCRFCPRPPREESAESERPRRLSPSSTAPRPAQRAGSPRSAPFASRFSVAKKLADNRYRYLGRFDPDQPGVGIHPPGDLEARRGRTWWPNPEPNHLDGQ